ncbi:hypothetical protein PHISCL_00191 [Aspergillus sclerotialis]|uniref:Uncharacterized protein n=1 Tax=Aspergillus sclerotialis TaxID=2070753 RepID=A0A3A3A1K1_9EURO|nr:hypothetical protein PHISCL_00191 [Aspergillus sclerotialis]
MKSVRLILASLLLLGLVLWGKTHLDRLRAQWSSFRALSDHPSGPAEKIGSVSSGGGSGSAMSAEELGIIGADDPRGSYGSGGMRPPESKFSTALQNTVNDKVIVVGKREDEDTDWVIDELPDWQHAIYTVDNPNAPLSLPQNKGKEANVYLQYIISNYDFLPSVIVFLHSHRSGYPQAWHTEFADHSNVRSIRMLQTDFVRKNGYANLRCNHKPGCPAEVQPFRAPDPGRPQEQALPEVWSVFFGDGSGSGGKSGTESGSKSGNGTAVPLPQVIAATCCSQFAVSREQVWARPLSDYQRFHRWVVETELDDDTSGRVMEYMWHIIFGKGPV